MIFCNRNITNKYFLLNCKTKSNCELRIFYQKLSSSVISPWNHIKDIHFIEIIQNNLDKHTNIYDRHVVIEHVILTNVYNNTAYGLL
jgi:hypothetical protein